MTDRHWVLGFVMVFCSTLMAHGPRPELDDGSSVHAEHPESKSESTDKATGTLALKVMDAKGEITPCLIGITDKATRKPVFLGYDEIVIHTCRNSSRKEEHIPKFGRAGRAQYRGKRMSDCTGDFEKKLPPGNYTL